jgi:histone H3/H4
LSEEFTIAPMRRLLKKAGDLKIGPEAAEEMRRVMGIYGAKLAEFAVESASSEGRRTVLEKDIRAAVVKLRKLEDTSSE